jgi:PKD repeat protein
MRKIYTTILLFAASVTAQAQNLVTNYSFETNSNCPNNYGQVSLATGWFPSSNNNNPQFHTEYLHACGTSLFSTPSNTWGNQAPATGQACMAICTTAPTVQTDYRENIYTSLTSPLVVGATYNVSFKISHCDNSQKATNNFGVKFATVPNFPINNVSQVYATAVVTDKINWTTVTGSFIADSAYTYICLGNFMTDANTTMTTSCGSCSFNLHGYYLDDVSVTPVPVNLPLAAFGKIVDSVCVNVPVTFFSASQNATSLYWDFGDSQTSTQNSPTHIYGSAGTYTVTLIAQNGNGSDTATFVIFVDPCIGSVNMNVLNAFVELYPNPSAGEVFLKVSGRPGQTYTVQLFDLSGRPVFTPRTIKDGEVTVLSRSIPAGAYVVNVQVDGGTLQKQLIIR